MAVLDKLLKVLEDITGRPDQFTSGDYDLSDWRDQMVALHSLQLQAQALIHLGSRLLSNMGDSAQGYKNITRKLGEGTY
ncbi:hypothetical protein [Metallosphaera javensis (ex Sakai et al. 2022)]|uniref:hypothetical protein n=1 Tax=Metallosphaera javensis (ex Sakai et al. 2022) TaxID=2775498 RepID=UPI00258C1F34|nr:MAG: hypothetical protein MjAS7_2079 [Metallosphaera javensis (ex Sakai et al. 2022)]